MIPVRILHDRRNPERITRVLSETATQGIAAEVWEASTNLKTVEASINKSHKDIIRWAKAGGFPEIAILEDDCQFTSRGAWQCFLAKKPAEFDLYLAGAYGIDRIGEPKAGVSLIRSFQGLHCYICHQRYYDRFLSAADDSHIDVAQSGLGQFFVCQPPIAIQCPGMSATARQWIDYNT